MCGNICCHTFFISQGGIGLPIQEENGLFRLDTVQSSYWLHITEFGHPEQLHYGRRLSGDWGSKLYLIRKAELSHAPDTAAKPQEEQK